MLFYSVLFFISIFAGGVAAISGFGIGSLLTPFMALRTGTSLAVAGISLAHFLGTAFRFWKWKKFINKKIFFSFGLTSAAGGLLGALFHNTFQNGILTLIFACLLILAGVTGLTDISEKWRMNKTAAWIAGALSGVFGGLVGNQGGIRSAAMLGFDLSVKEFVATTTGIALIVDLVRMPVYFFLQWKDLYAIWPLITLASLGVLIGTEWGIRVLPEIPGKMFKKVVCGIILLIGVFMLLHR